LGNYIILSFSDLSISLWHFLYGDLKRYFEFANNIFSINIGHFMGESYRTLVLVLLLFAIFLSKKLTQDNFWSFLCGIFQPLFCERGYC